MTSIPKVRCPNRPPSTPTRHPADKERPRMEHTTTEARTANARISETVGALRPMRTSQFGNETDAVQP